uniref:Retrotransposon gag domain-containing protein n=1 Tax=Vitis vinifera TaxID=29760 RepID=A5C4B2_VITVI|nr:hypothetical protein VITISV_010411 [Vitis vinifera]
MAVRNFSHHAKPLEATKEFRTPCEISHESNGVIAGDGAKLCMPYWIRDIEGRLVKIETPRETELEVCLNIMDVPPEDQNSQHVPPTEQLVIQPHIVPLLPTFHGMESENPYSHIKEFEEDQWFERRISNFLAKENEKFYECWERYMEAINACPHHDFDTWLLVSYFYDDMSSSMKQLLETMCERDFMSKNLEEAMDFLSYVAEVSRGWDEPNAREVGRMKSQPNAKGGMYVLNEDIDIKSKGCNYGKEIGRARNEEVREMFGDQANVIGQFKPNNNASYGNTYNSNWRNYPNFSWKPKPPQYTQPAQAPHKIVRDFVGDQKSINAQLNQRFDSMESTLNKRMDGMQNDLSQKIDNVQYTISRLTNLKTVQEKGKFPSQPHQNPKGIHEVEAQEGESSKPTSKPKHDEESVAEKEKSEENKRKRKGKSTKKDDHESSVDEEAERIVIKEDMLKKHMPPPFPQALHGKKGTNNASEIFEVLRQVKVNISLLDMIKQVLTYAKFLKDLCTVKRGLNVNKKAFLTDSCPIGVSADLCPAGAP